MATASSSPPPDSPSEETQTNQEAMQQDMVKETTEEVTYKTKSIQFLGRNTPIILQNENGPCPLLAICNVLLLRNNLNLNPDCYEVSQERLMIDDFEFTPECAIFDLLDIPLYHGWIVDPQDVEAANAIGSKSYNALMGELVALETQNVEAREGDQNPGEDSVDFAAATTAALGVPSPCLSKTRSFDESPPAAAELRRLRKGDLEEETELLQALQLSQGQGNDPAPNTHGDTTSLDSAFTFSDANQTTTHGDNIYHLEQFKSDDISCRSQHDDVPDALTSPVSSDEPMYEGEECVNAVAPLCADKEPVYEGESLLGKRAEKTVGDCSSEGKSTDGLTAEEGELIRNFMKNSASQLTFCGLFRLQEGLKERELCVFFRNNHFCTMFKYEGELYLLATDQGYLNQPDLVWEKLNEVNGDTAFMTATFKDFKIDSSTTGASGTWDERNAVTNTADYLASINNVADTGIDVNSDLQLAIALQQQEFEDQSPRSNPTPQPTSLGASRLITGPQVPRSSHRPSSAAASSSKHEGKSSKDSKCRIM
ncbi:unnamed protein product [Thlaspi arvense]|uniref:MINDY deubiquitinase domain-containing protein n=1 Tax=Thlaspi arvense TaxID=13288 RepID=A0AAU9STN2_THLAR|nr:unnamed protein product [Thlaspi arvense]